MKTFHRSKEDEQRKVILCIFRIHPFKIPSGRLEPIDPQELFEQIEDIFAGVVKDYDGVEGKQSPEIKTFFLNIRHAESDEPARAFRAVEDFKQRLRELSLSKQINIPLSIAMGSDLLTIRKAKIVDVTWSNSFQHLYELASQLAPGETAVTAQFQNLISDWAYCIPHPTLDLSLVTGRRTNWANPTLFLGRESILNQLIERLSTFQRERSARPLLISGEAGIGKSQLLLQVENLATKMGIACQPFLFDPEQISFYRSFQRFLTQLIQSPLISHNQGLLLLRPIVDEIDFWAQAQLDQIKAMTIKVLRAIAEKHPVIVLAEDLHRASPSVLAAFTEIVQSLNDLPLWIIATSRQSSPDFSEIITLAPLSADASLELLKSGLTESKKINPHLLQSIVDQCKGNPFLLVECARHINNSPTPTTAIPARLDFLFDSILDALTSPQQKQVMRASLFGNRAQIMHLARLDFMSRKELSEILEPTQLFLFNEDGNSISFRHDLLRDKAYERIPPDTKRHWHEQAAKTLIGFHIPPEEIAHHFLESDNKQSALSWSLKATERLSHLPKSNEARFFLSHADQLARALNDKPSLIAAYDLLFAIEGRQAPLPKVEEMFRSAAGDPLVGNLPQAHERRKLAKAKLLFQRGLIKESSELLVGAKEEQLGERGYELPLLSGKILFQQGDNREAARHALSALRSKTLPKHHRSHVYNLLGAIAFRDGELRQAKDFYDKAHQSAFEANDLAELRKTVMNLGAIASRHNNKKEERDRYLEACSIAFKLGDVSGLCSTLRNLGRCNFRSLEISEALSNYSQALDILGNDFSDALVYQVRLALGAALRYLGDFEASLAHLEGAIHFFEQMNDHYHLGQSFRMIALLHRDIGNNEKALAFLDRSIACLENVPNQAQFSKLLRIEILCTTGRFEEGRREFADFKSLYKRKDKSQTIDILAARIESIITGRGDVAILQGIAKMLDDDKTLTDPIEAFSLAVEAMEYGSDLKIRSRADSLAKTILNHIPTDFQKAFQMNRDFKRYRELSLATKIPT